MKVTLTEKDPKEILKAIASEARRQAEGEFSFGRTARTQRQVQARQNRGMALLDFAKFVEQIEVEGGDNVGC